MKIRAIGIAALVAAGFAGTCFASDAIAVAQSFGSRFGLQLNPNYSNAVLSVSGPNNFHASTFSRGGSLSIDLMDGGRIADGSYNYQLSAQSPQTIDAGTSINAGRNGQGSAVRAVGVSVSGSFLVKGGQIIIPQNTTTAGRQDR
jgi:hypothetical protein